MIFSTTIDNAGRLVLPKKIREALCLTPESKLNIEVVGDKIQLSEATAEPDIRRRGKRRVITGWKGFDAARAVSEAQRNQATRLESR